MLAWSLEHPDLLVGWVRAEGVTIAPSPELLVERLRELGARPDRQGLTAEVKAGIRDLLRGHGYKPSGRGKPASEFLARAAARGELPEINVAVDINNLMSLQTGWPISIFDLDAATDGEAELEIRRGAPGEAFVFNAAGQTIDIGGLICVARRGGEAIGNPVRDSMATKIAATTRRVLAVPYASRAVADRSGVANAAEELAGLLASSASAQTIETGVLPLTS